MGRVPPLTIYAKAPGGVNDRLHGVVEAASVEGGPMGPETLTFGIQGDTRFLRSQLLPYTRYAVELAGVPIWSGWAMQAPTQRGEDQRFAVQAVGFQDHLRDRTYDKTFVTQDMSKFVNTAANPNVTLSGYQTGLTPEVGSNGIILPLPKNYGVKLNRAVSVTLDAGPNNTFIRVAGTWQVQTTIAGTWFLYVRLADTPDPITAPAINDLVATTTATGGANNTFDVTSPTARRYLHVFGYWAGADAITGDDYSFRVKDLRVATTAAWMSAGASILKASDVIRNVLTNRGALISTDQSLISSTSFNIPEWDLNADALSHIEGVNAFHAWQFFLTGDATPRAVYRAVPTTPKWVISRQDGHHVNLSSANDGSELYNGVIVEYTDAAGVESSVTVTASPDNTLVGRAGRSRYATLRMRSASTSAAATQIANTYLAAHATTPIKAAIQARGHVRDFQSGAKVPAGWVQPNDIVLLADEIDPDTGAVGRKGPVANVKYDHDNLTAAITIDSRSDYIDAILNRLAAVTGS